MLNQDASSGVHCQLCHKNVTRVLIERTVEAGSQASEGGNTVKCLSEAGRQAGLSKVLVINFSSEIKKAC